jgi:hypothetical protein
MSSWYVLSALGFYPVCPGSNQYVIGTPLFDRATLHLEDERSFTIEARRDAPENFYVQSARLNDREYPYGFLEHGAIAGGGELVLELGPEPNEGWASAPEHRPRSRMEAEPVVAVPHIQAPKRVFRETLEVSIGHPDPDAEIHFTLDGSEPDASSERYVGPLRLTRTSEVRAIAVREGAPPSVPAVAHFEHLDRDWTISIDTPYSPQYTAGGELALIDGLRGVEDFRVGSWQGWQGTDLQVTVDLGEPQSVWRVAVGFLQDVRSWIWLPRALEIQTSVDGEHFELRKRVLHDVEPDDYALTIRNLGATLGGVRARYVRIVAENAGPVPDWHPGRGHPRWIFADEISID